MVGNKRRRTNGGFDTTRQEHHSESSAPAVSQPTFLNTFDRKYRYPIFSALCDCLSIAEIVSLTKTCKTFSDLYQYLLPIQWDVDKALRHYVDDAQGFRSQMARSDALIVGNFVAQFFERVFRDREPLDVWVREGEESELFIKYLFDIAGYSEIDIIEVDEGPFFSRVERRRFTRDTDVKSAIRLHTMHCPPVFNAVSEADFTAQVNIMSWNKAYSVFALPTFILKTCYLLRSWDERAANSANILSRKGLNVQGVLWPEDKRRNHPIRARRRVGDRYTWTIPFDTKKVQMSKTPDYVLEHVCFECSALDAEYDDNEPYPDLQGEIRYYCLSMGVLESKVLKYSYTFGEFAMREFFKARLHASTILELRKLNAAERPPNYEQILLHTTSDAIDGALWGFNPPTSWIYRDDEVAKWYKAWEMHKPEDADSK
ncbi:hypothetical protein BDR22DRAFT_816662 [Usnea florida]